LLELTIAVAITCMLAIWAAERLLHEVDSVAERAAGQWLLDLRHALDGMLARHGDTLGAGDVPTDAHGQAPYANPWSPTLAELKRQGHLPGAFPDPGPLGMQAVITLWRDDACPGPGCRIQGLAYGSVLPSPQEPAHRPVDFSRVAGVIMATDGAGGSVSELAPDRLRGAAFDLPNPPVPGMARLAMGTVAVHASRAADDAGRYLRQRDARNPQFLGDVSTAGTLSTGEHLKLGGIAIAGNPCPENGLLAREADGSLLNCAAGIWSAPGGFGGAYASHSDVGCGIAIYSTPNPRTGQCSCPPGFRAVMVASGGDPNDAVWAKGYICMR
jgi:type II secretory pathway pseudopilin PulG